MVRLLPTIRLSIRPVTKQLMGKKKFDTDPTDGAGNAYAKTVDVNQQLDKKVNVADMRKPASDVAGLDEVNTKQDKIAYTPADDSKVVHSKDMRKPASDVAGIEEVNTKQDKISYTPADDSKVVHDNHDGTIKISGKSFTPAVLDSVIGKNAQPIDTDVDTLAKPGLYYVSGSAPNSPFKTLMMLETKIQYDWNAFRGIQIAYKVMNNSEIAVRCINPNGSLTRVGGTTPWALLSDDSKVAHLSGANNFDTVPTVNNNPLLLASSLPSDLARTGQPQTFTAAQTFSIAPTITDASKDKGDNQAATMADLKSLENSAWRVMTGSSYFFASFTCLYKINTAKKRIELIAFGETNNQWKGTIVDLSSIISGITSVDGWFSVNNGSGFSVDTSKVNFSGTKLTGEIDGGTTQANGGILSHKSLGNRDMDNNPCYVYYTGLV